MPSVVLFPVCAASVTSSGVFCSEVKDWIHLAMAAESDQLAVVQELSETQDVVGDMEADDLWAKLPEEVQQKIFRRLRWRSLFRICVVSKSFNDGINRYVHELPIFRTAVSNK